MTQTPPEQPDTPDRRAERLGGDPQFTDTYTPPHYPGNPEGPGRWVTVVSAGVELGYVWHTETGGLGFIATTDEGRARTPEFAVAFSKAAALNVDPSDVFDAWADRDGMGLWSGPVHTGDVDTLT